MASDAKREIGSRVSSSLWREKEIHLPDPQVDLDELAKIDKDLSRYMQSVRESATKLYTAAAECDSQGIALYSSWLAHNIEGLFNVEKQNLAKAEKRRKKSEDSGILRVKPMIEREIRDYLQFEANVVEAVDRCVCCKQRPRK